MIFSEGFNTDTEFFVRASTKHILKMAHSKKITFQQEHIPKRSTFQKEHIPKRGHSKKSTFQKWHIPKKAHSNRAHSKRSTFQIENLSLKSFRNKKDILLIKSATSNQKNPKQ